MKKTNIYSIHEVCAETNLEQETVYRYVEEGWVITQDQGKQSFDEEDLARINLIIELQEKFGVNEEAIPIILHLLDQIHCLKNGVNQNLESMLRKK